ncbi:MAG: hypothetical protein K8I04_03920 [Gammaproteobacteria bacterium]|nr:hypothetical protein [Gammaproteobacteria bacterium]
MRELDHVLQKTYVNKDTVSGFLKELVKNKKLAGEDPCAFWASAHFLSIQDNGHSQKEILEIFDAELHAQCKLRVKDCGRDGGAYIYLDDVMFSGNRVGNDLVKWIKEQASMEATVHVIVAAIHTSGEYMVGKRIKEAIADSGKKIEIHYWRSLNIENRKYYKNDSEVLWPCEVPDDELVKQYLAKPHKFPFEPRKPGGKLGPFSCEEGRQLLEREFLIAGLKIRSFSEHPKDVMRPLGFSPFGLGFGSMIATFRNCPNNTPLALWWGDPEATSGPFHWYPLLPRKTYGGAKIVIPW